MGHQRTRVVSLLAAAVLASCASGHQPDELLPQSQPPPRMPQVLQSGAGSQFQLLGALPADSTSVYSLVGNGLYTFAGVAIGSPPDVSTEYLRIADDGTFSQADPHGVCADNFLPMIAARDNSLWVATDGNELCRVAEDGSSGHLYTAGASGTEDVAVAPGPDGNVWFAQWYASGHTAIGKMSLSGSVLGLYTIPGSGPSGVNSLSPGPDGNVWFTTGNSGTDAIGKITPSGVVTQYSFSSAASQIANPGDGLLYFWYGKGIGTISTTGATHTYPLSAAELGCDGSPPCDLGASLIVGPFSNLWFESPKGIQSFSHTVHTYGAEITSPLTASSNFEDVLAFGNDGTLWFYGGNDSKGNPRIAIYLAHSMTVTPTSITLTGAGKTASLKVQEKYFSGTFYAQSSNAAIPSVSPSSSAGGDFTVTAHAAGSATITVSDGSNLDKNNRVNVAVTVK